MEQANSIAKEIVDKHRGDLGPLNKIIECLSVEVRRLIIIKLLEDNKR